MGWGDHHDDPSLHVLNVGAKLAAAVRDYLRTPSGRHRQHLDDILDAYDAAVEKAHDSRRHAHGR